MYLSKRVKVVAGVSALLGVVMAGGAAFTAAGLVDTAGSNGFVGGTISQEIDGTSVSNITYTYSNPTAGDGDSDTALITGVALTFGDQYAVSAIPTISFTGTDSGEYGTNDEYESTEWTCSSIAAVAEESTATSSCSVSADSTLSAGLDGAQNVESISVTVPGLNPEP